MALPISLVTIRIVHLLNMSTSERISMTNRKRSYSKHMIGSVKTLRIPQRKGLF